MKYCDLDFYLLGSHKVKSKVTIRTPIYDFIYVDNGPPAPNYHRLAAIRRQNSANLIFVLSNSLKVKPKDNIRKPMYDFIYAVNELKVLHGFRNTAIFRLAWEIPISAQAGLSWPTPSNSMKMA